MTIIERLEDSYEASLGEVKRLRESADGLTVEADRIRRRADLVELEAVEARTAANILREAGLRVDRTDDGTPRVQVDRVLAEPVKAGG